MKLKDKVTFSHLVTTQSVVMQSQTLRVDQRRGRSAAAGRRSNALAWKQAGIGTRGRQPE